MTWLIGAAAWAAVMLLLLILISLGKLVDIAERFYYTSFNREDDDGSRTP